MVLRAFNLSTREAEKGRTLSLRPAYLTEQVPREPKLHRETLSQKKKKEYSRAKQQQKQQQQQQKKQINDKM